MFRSKHPRDIFNEIKWRSDLANCRIYYIHRGVPGDMKIDVYIPYHRITRIEFNNHPIFERNIRPLPKRKNIS